MRRISIGLLAAAVLLLGTPALAKDMNGRFGVGGLRNSLGQQGFAFKYWAGHLGVQALIGMQRVNTSVEFTDDGGNTLKGDDSIQSLSAAMRILYNIARAKDVNLYAGGGFGVGNAAVEFADPKVKGTSATEVAVELLLGAEYYMSNHFSIQAEVGIPIRFPGEDGPAIAGGAPAVPAEGFGIAMGQVATWGAGFNFYF